MLATYSESRTQQEIRLAAPLVATQLLRNNIGCFTDARGVPVRYGLANESKAQNKNLKSGDLIGWTRVTVTPDLVGQTFAVFTSVEVKRGGWVYGGTGREAAQKKWVDLVRQAGGFAGFASDPASFFKIVKRY